MTLADDLVGAEWRARKGAYLALAALVGATAGMGFLILSVVDGLEEAVGDELSRTLGGEVRLSRGKTGLGDGALLEDLPDTVATLRYADPSIVVAPRLETQAILLQEGDFSGGAPPGPGTRAAAILIGVDPQEDPRVVDLDALIVQGEGRRALARAYRGEDGERLVPIVVGVPMLETGNATPLQGAPTWDSIYNMTAGLVENGQVVSSRAVVVGVYQTGFRMIDRLVVYAPRGEVARLLGHHPEDPPANVLLAKTSAPARLAEGASLAGLESLEARTFRETYLGPVFTGVRASAWVIVGLLAVMTAGWVAYAMARHVDEDRRKLATLRAVGIPPRVLGGAYVSLIVAMGAAGACVGVVLAAAVAPLVGLAAGVFGLPSPSPSWGPGAALVALASVSTLAAAAFATRRALSTSIRDALYAP